MGQQNKAAIYLLLASHCYSAMLKPVSLLLDHLAYQADYEVVQAAACVQA